MRDSRIYRLIDELKKDMYTKLMKFAVVELVAKEALYQIVAFLSFFTAIPCYGYLFKKVMNKRIARLKGVIQEDSHEKIEEAKKKASIEEAGGEEVEEKKVE